MILTILAAVLAAIAGAVVKWGLPAMFRSKSAIEKASEIADEQKQDALDRPDPDSVARRMQRGEFGGQ